LISTVIIFIQQRRLFQQREDLVRLTTHATNIQQQFVNFQQNRIADQKALTDFQFQLQRELNDNRQQFDQHQLQSLKLLQDSLQQGMAGVREHVEQRLAEGFAHTNATFTDVVKRLAIIDEAQKRITELSGNVVGLQEILIDKRSRGVFGEVQLNSLIYNVLPETHFSLQHTFSNGKRADCVLFLPEPTGTIAIDAKFPLESYRRYTDNNLAESDRRIAEQQFRQDIRKHVQDVASKYIIAGETTDGAVLFIPAEAIFADIHAHYYDVVEEAHKLKVWLASPTTMMAILNTARAVLKDAATREQIHIIQKYLTELAKDFGRFQQRMQNLARHIEQAHGDVQDIKTSADKITTRFEKIERVELESKSMNITI
jgi:DNA recombination protein RmuC